MLKFIHLLSFCVILFKDLSESIRTPLIVFNHEDSGIHYDNILDIDSNGTIVVENSTKLYQTNYRIKSFDYDLEDKYLVWSSNDYPYPIWLAEFKFKDTNDNRTKVQITKRTIIALKNSQTKLAVDWVHNLIYFFKYQTLNVVHIDNPEVSYELTRKESPSEQWKFSYGNIAVNPEEGFIIWTEYNSIDGIAIMRKCNEDGSDQKILVYKDMRVPICLAIDYKTNSILWIDNELHSLSSIDYFGNNRKTLRQSKDLFSDCSAMDILEGYVYWSSPKNNAIQRINISVNDTQEGTIETVVTSDSDIDFVKILSQTNQKMSKNYCSSANCTQICLPENNENYRCLCADTPQLEACNETKVLYSSPKIPEQKQNTTTVSQLVHSGSPLLLFTASKRDIRLAKLSDNQLLHYTDSEFVYKLDSYVSTIDYSLSGNYLLWFKTDISSYTHLSKTILMGSPIDETTNNSLTIDSMKTMVNLSENSLLKSMAIDWVHNLAYFPICESAMGIFVANLSTPHYLYLVIPQTACVTKDVRVDPIESYLFWSEYHESTGYSTASHGYRYSSYSYRYRNSHSSKSMIKRSTQDGQDVIVLVERQYIRKNSLTLDLEEKKVYWIDMNSVVNKLCSVDYTGDNIVTINPSSTLFEDFSSMDLFKDHIYWTNTEDDTIRRISKRQSTETESQIVLQSGIDIDAIKIMDSSRQPNGTPKCVNHVCPHICLPSSGQGNFTCFCPRGQTWSNSTQACVLSSSRFFGQSSSTTVAPTRRTTTAPFTVYNNETKLLFVVYKEGIFIKQNLYDLNTQYIESIELKTSTEWITELDYDFKGNYMLWLESSVFEGFSLYAAPIDKTRDNELSIIYAKKIVSKTYNAKRLAFDWIHKLVYLSVPKGIEVFTIGERVYSYDIVTHEDTQGDLALDPVEGLIFWSQWRYTAINVQHVGRIFRANQDGSDTRVLISSSKIPNTLTVDTESKTIYWIDTSLFALYSFDYQGNNKTTVLNARSVFDGAFSMDLFGENIFWSNYDKNGIFMTEKSGANGSNRITLVNAYTDIEGIKVFDSSRQSNGPNRCLTANCSTFQFCLPVQQDYRCVCYKPKSVFCSENTQSTDRETTMQSLSGVNPINSQFISDEHINNISKKLDQFHSLLNSTVMKGQTSESNHHWVAIIVISVAVNVILIALFIYRKKKMNPFSKYIMAKFKNDREEIFLDERVDDDI